MEKNFIIRFRVTSQEMERIKNHARAKGCSSMSQFIRGLVLERNLWMENKIQETNVAVKEILQILKN